jgi:hypothetical protein
MTEFPETQSLLLANIQSLENREAWAEFVQIYRPEAEKSDTHLSEAVLAVPVRRPARPSRRR